MSVEEIKHQLASLSVAEQSEVSAYLYHLRRAIDPDYQAQVANRLSDRDPEHWLSPEEFERRLDQR